MSSWRSRFRKTKTPDANDTKTISNFPKNPDEGDGQKKRISRFLRRSKHDEDNSERPRPRSFFLERNASDLNGVRSPRNLGDPPSVQDILDRNRRERALAKSPRPWRKFLTGDRSPNANKRGDAGNGGNEDYSYKSRYKDENRNYDSERYENSSQISNDSERNERRGRYSDENKSRKSGMEESRNDRKSSKDGSLRSDSDRSTGKTKNERSRSASPYDNVEESPRRRRERRSKSLYVESRNGETTKDSETSSVADKAVTPRSKRRERMRRSESQDTVNSERSVRSQTRIETETFVLRKPKASYPSDDGENVWTSRGQDENEAGKRCGENGGKGDVTSGERKPRSQNESGRSPRGNAAMSNRKHSGYATDSATRGSEKVSRSHDKGTYSRRSSENILGATLNYIEHRPSNDYLSTATSKMMEEFKESSRDGRGRGRYRGARADKSIDSTSIADSEREHTIGRKFSYSSTESTSYRPSSARRDSYSKARPKSLYDFHDTSSCSDNLAKPNEDESALYGDRYRPRNDPYGKDEQRSSWRRPKTLFMADDEKNESAYRGSWSVSVPKKPSHLKDFSKPDENSGRYSWRKSKREKEEAESTSRSRRADTNICSKDAAKAGNKEDRISYRRRQSQQEGKSSEEKPDVKVPPFEFTVSQANDEESRKTEEASGEAKKMDSLGEDTVVRRRRRDHAPHARPSSVYCAKTERVPVDPTTAMKEEKVKNVNDDDDDDDLRRRYKRRPNINLDSEDIKTGLRKKSAVERRLRSKYAKERPKSVNLTNVFADKYDFRHLSKANPVHDPIGDTVNEVKREFERLLRRTEDWKLRTESLNSRATVLSSSYRSLNRAITGVRDESDDMYALIDNIGERLNVNDSVGYPDTEDEWRRAFEAGKLVEKALRIIDHQKRYPKPDFEYSDSESEPATPGKPFYDMPRGIPWFSRYTTRESSSSRLSSLADQYSTRKADNHMDGSSRSYLSYRPSLDMMSSLSVSTSARYSPSYVSDTYSRTSRYQDSFLDYKTGSNGLPSSNGRIIPETAV